MTNLETYKPHSKLVLTAVLSSGVTAVSCVTYIILCAIALIYRSDCGIPHQQALTTDFFWKIVFLSYIQDEDCQSASWINGINVTTQYTVYILLILTLTASSVCLIMACILTTVVCNKETAQYVTITVYAYIGFCIASLVVDLTFATHFGMDYILLGDLLDNSSNQGSTELFAMYYGAFALMTISLKGYVAHAINLVLLVLLVIYAVENWNQRKDEHSIHKMGALNAFEPGRKPKDNWSHHPHYPPFTRSSHINHGFVNEEERPRSPVRELTQPDFLPTNRSFDRSDSWHHSRAPRDPGQNGRPFSYLEDIKRPVPVRPPASPNVDPHWRRDQWQPVAGPPVPAPDYSPQTPRRLKSALKSGY